MRGTQRKRTTRSHPQGIRSGGFRSSLEKSIAEELKSRGIAFGFERKSYCYTLTKRYTPDFFLCGDKLIVEAKGWFRSSDRTKLLAVREANPELNIRLVFQRANSRLSKKSKTTYGEWADKHGFRWAEKLIPKEWTNEHSKEDYPAPLEARAGKAK